MPDRQSSFFDEARIYVKGGTGGNGALSFRREKYVPFGGPDGGDGGRGGSVFLRVSPNENTLFQFQHRRQFKAERGGSGSGAKKHGRKGQDLVIDVPPGTEVSTDEGVIADLVRPGEMLLVARGGRGGLGNVHFSTPTNRAPRYAEKGEPGEERWLQLELKMIGDVGLVGLPNAGKSSLLAAISAARPKIASYPFTTLTPNLGVAEVGDLAIVVADIPGLIEGAHRGVGLGHQFLRHVERSRMLLYVVDASAPDPVADYETVRNEAVQYSAALAERPSLVALNKMDLPEAAARRAALVAALGGPDVAYPVSALTGEGVAALLTAIAGVLAALPAPAAPEESGLRVYRLAPEAETWTVERRPEGFYVRGKPVERLMAMTDLNQEDAAAELQRRLARMGVLEALERAGVQSGDAVQIGDSVLEWT
ncbi:MAG TPA: GTPase ObgE [Chloroflexota bacterium]|nr:GTPase ObgE [Chloroflexota bacterium]